MRRVVHFAAEIEFLEDRPSKFANHADRLIAAKGIVHLGDLREEAEDVEIAADISFNARMLHLHDGARSAFQAGVMDLPDRSRCESRRVEIREALGDGPAQLGFHYLDCHFRRVGWRAGLELGQFSGQLLPDQIRASAEHLAQLDEGGAQVGQRQPHACFQRQIGKGLPLPAAKRIANGLKVHVVHPGCQTILGQDAPSPPPPGPCPRQTRSVNDLMRQSPCH